MLCGFSVCNIGNNGTAVARNYSHFDRFVRQSPWPLVREIGATIRFYILSCHRTTLTCLHRYTQRTARQSGECSDHSTTSSTLMIIQSLISSDNAALRSIKARGEMLQGTEHRQDPPNPATTTTTTNGSATDTTALTDDTILPGAIWSAGATTAWPTRRHQRNRRSVV